MLNTDHVRATSQRVDWTEVEDIFDKLVLPEPTLDDLEEYGYSPEELAEQGHDVPEDGEEALAYAAEEFHDPEYHDWSSRFVPMMGFLWPCDVKVNLNEAAQAMHREGIACVLVNGSFGGAKLQGIALTGGGMNLAGHIAAAYMCCGQVPPATVLSSALEIGSTHMADELRQAAAQAIDVMGSDDPQVARIQEYLSDSAPRP